MAPRNNQSSTISCDKCRSLKVKCVRENTEATCAKCAKSGHRCCTTERPRCRDQTALKRVNLRDLTSRLDDVLDYLARPGEPRPTVNTDCETSGATSLQTTISTGTDQCDIEEVVIDVRNHEHHKTGRTSVFRGTWADRLGLDWWLLGHLLRRYRTMQHHFPFVVISEAWDLQHMLIARPVLLLAVVSSSACYYPQVQRALIKDLKDTLTRRVMIGGENSLELLQAFLVHLAWSQYHMEPRSQLVYRYLQVAVSMAVDLHLNTDPSMVMRQAGFFASDASLQLDCGRALSRSHEVLRAALGCFYLSSVLSSTMLRPNTLPFSDSTLAWAATLARSPEVSTDSSITLLIQYQRLLEGVFDLYREERHTNDWTRITMHAKRMATLLDSWWVGVPPHLHLTYHFASRYYHARIRIYEMGLLYHYRTRDDVIVPALDTSILHNNLMALVVATKNYLDALLAVDGAEWNSLPYEECSRTIVAFFILYKLAVGPREIPGWDVASCRSTIDLAQYLDNVAECLAHSSQAFKPGQQANGGVYFVLPAILRTVRKTFLLVRDAPHLAMPGDRVHMDLSKEQFAEEFTRPKERARCPAASFFTDRALVLDQDIDWCGVELNGVLDPAAQLAKNEKLWSDLLHVNAVGNSS